MVTSMRGHAHKQCTLEKDTKIQMKRSSHLDFTLIVASAQQVLVVSHHGIDWMTAPMAKKENDQLKQLEFMKLRHLHKSIGNITHILGDVWNATHVPVCFGGVL
jgi:hypothetical protein